MCPRAIRAGQAQSLSQLAGSVPAFTEDFHIWVIFPNDIPCFAQHLHLPGMEQGMGSLKRTWVSGVSSIRDSPGLASSLPGSSLFLCLGMLLQAGMGWGESNTGVGSLWASLGSQCQSASRHQCPQSWAGPRAPELQLTQSRDTHGVCVLGLHTQHMCVCVPEYERVRVHTSVSICM